MSEYAFGQQPPENAIVEAHLELWYGLDEDGDPCIFYDTDITSPLQLLGLLEFAKTAMIRQPGAGD